MRRPILVLFCAGAALLAAGCGGGGGSSGGGQPLSHSELQSHANDICTKLKQEEQPDLASSSKDAIDRNLGRIDSALSDLQRLEPPQQDAARYKDLLTRFRRTAAFVKANEARLIRLTNALKAHPSDSRTDAQYQALVRPFVEEAKRAGADATALGLQACAAGFTGSSS